MGETRNLVKRLFGLKQASLCHHNISKDTKIQNLGVIFSSFNFFKIKYKIMISDFENTMDIMEFHFIFINGKL